MPPPPLPLNETLHCVMYLRQGFSRGAVELGEFKWNCDLLELKLSGEELNWNVSRK